MCLPLSASAQIECHIRPRTSPDKVKTPGIPGRASLPIPSRRRGARKAVRKGMRRGRRNGLRRELKTSPSLTLRQRKLQRATWMICESSARFCICVLDPPDGLSLHNPPFKTYGRGCTCTNTLEKEMLDHCLHFPFVDY